MNESELKNAIIELNYIGIITDKELLKINEKLKEHFKIA